jgi:hypothetical protein
MFAAAILAASLIAPSGVTAGIQADPVCLPVTAQPGHSYPLTVYVSGGSLTLEVTPAHGTLERTLHQVQPSWVSFAANPAGPGEVALTLAVPSGTAPGAYWSDLVATAQGGGGQGSLGAAAATALVFTVGPPGTPPPPCSALDLAQYTGKFPAWPTKAFATTGWPQVFARERASEPRPYLSPTAGTGSQAPPAPAYSPAASTSGGAGPNRDAWVVLIGLAVLVVAMLAKRRRS